MSVRTLGPLTTFSISLRSAHRWFCMFMPLALVLLLAGCGSGKAIFCTGTCIIQTGAEFVFATTNNGEVATLKVDTQTGSLGAPSMVSGPQMSLGMAAAGFQHLYASDFGSAAIYGYSIDSTTGALTAVTGSPFSTGQFSVPAGLAATPNGSFLYTADALQIDGYTIGSTGALSPISGSPFSSDGSVQAFVSSAGFLYAAEDDPPGGVLAFSIGSTGTLTPIPGSPFLVPGQTVLNSHPFGVVADFLGKFVFLSLNQTNQIAVFSVDQSTGILTSVPGSPFDAGALPSFLIRTGNYLYAMNSGDQTISAYSVDPTSGVLTPVSGSPFTAGATGGMAINPEGTRLYAAAPAAGAIVGFTINSDGSLTPLDGSPFAITGPVLLTYVQMPSTGG